MQRPGEIQKQAALTPLLVLAAVEAKRQEVAAEWLLLLLLAASSQNPAKEKPLNHVEEGLGERYCNVTDQLGSVTKVTNAAAEVVWSSEYNPFGKTAGIEGLYDFDGSYAGHQPDNDVGLIYMWNRWQDPETGRFLSEDPARDGASWYSYAHSNPLRFTDPTGLSTVPPMDRPSGTYPLEEDDDSLGDGYEAGKAAAEAAQASAEAAAALAAALDDDDDDSGSGGSGGSSEGSSGGSSGGSTGGTKSNPEPPKPSPAPVVSPTIRSMISRDVSAKSVVSPDHTWDQFSSDAVKQEIYRKYIWQVGEGNRPGGSGGPGGRLSQDNSWMWDNVRGIERIGRGDFKQRLGEEIAAGRVPFDPFKALTRAATGEGNFGIGAATRAEADALGRSWVGEGFREMSGGKGLVSADGLRTYRFPTAKSSDFATTGVQANLERLVNGKVVGNGHLDILP